MEVYLHQLSLILEANTTIGKESDAISNLQTLQRTLKTELIIPFSSQFSPKIIETIFSTILSLSFKESTSSNQNHITYSNQNTSNPMNSLLNNYAQISFQDSLHHFLNHIVSLMKSFCPSTLLMILTNLSQTKQQKEENSVMVVWISQLIPILQLNDPLTIQLCAELIEYCPNYYLQDIPDSFWVLLREKLDKEEQLNILKNGIDLSNPDFAKQASILCQKYPDDTIPYLVEKAYMHFISLFLSYLPETVSFDTVSLNARISDAINLDSDFDEMIYSLQALPYLIERLSYNQKHKNHDMNESQKDDNKNEEDYYCSDEITALQPVWKGILRQLKSLSSSKTVQNFNSSRTFFIDTLLYGESRGFVKFDDILPFIDLENEDANHVLLSAYLNVIFNNHLDNEYIQSRVMAFLKMIIGLSSIDRVDDEANCKVLNDMINFISKTDNFNELMKINEKEFFSILSMLFNTKAYSFNKKSIILSQIKFILNHFEIINQKMSFINLNVFVSRAVELVASCSLFTDESFKLLLTLIDKLHYQISIHQLDWFSNPSLIHRNIKLLQLSSQVDSSFVFELLSNHLIGVNDVSEALKIILSNAELDSINNTETQNITNLLKRNRKVLSASVRIAMNYFSKCIEIIGFDINEELRKYNMNIRLNNANTSNSNSNSSDSFSSAITNEITWFENGLLENLFYDIQCEFEFSRFGRFLSVITEFIFKGRKAAKLSQNAKILYIIYSRFLGSLIPVSASHLLTGLIQDFKEEFQNASTSDNNENLTSIVTSNKKQFFELYFPHNHFDAVVDAAASLFGIEETIVMYPELINHSITYSYSNAKKFASYLSQPLPKLPTFLAFLGVEKHKEWVIECIKSMPFKKWIFWNCSCDGHFQLGDLNASFLSYIDEIKKNLTELKESNSLNLKDILESSQKIKINEIVNNIKNNNNDKDDFIDSLDDDHKKLLIAINEIYNGSGSNEEDTSNQNETEVVERNSFSFTFNKEELIKSQENEVPFKINQVEPSTMANLISFFWHSYSLQAGQNSTSSTTRANGNDNTAPDESNGKEKEKEEEEIRIGIGNFTNIIEIEKFVLDHVDNAKLVLGFLTYVQRFDSFTIDVDKWVILLKLQNVSSRDNSDDFYIYSSALIIDAMTKKVNEKINQKSAQIESSQEIEISKEVLMKPSDFVPDFWMNFIRESLEFIGVYNEKSLITLFFKKNGYAHLTIRAVFRLFGLITTFLDVTETIASETAILPSPLHSNRKTSGKTKNKDNEEEEEEHNDKNENNNDDINNDDVVKKGPMLSCQRIADQINRDNISLGIAEVISTIPTSLSNISFYIHEGKDDDDDTGSTRKIEKTQSAVEFERLVKLAKSVASDSKHYDQLLKTCLNTIKGRTTDEMYCEVLSTLSSTLFSKSRGKQQEGPKINYSKSGVNKDEFSYDYDLNSMECYRLIPTNYQHNQCLLSFGEKLQNIQSGNNVLVPSSFIQTLLIKLDKELVVTREFFLLIFNFALNTEQYLHICQTMEEKCPSTQDHLRIHFNLEETYKNFFNCKPPSFERGVYRTFLSKFTIIDPKQLKNIIVKMKNTTGIKRIHPSLCYSGSKKIGMKPWKNSHFANLPTLLSIGYIDLKTVMRNFTEIGTSPIEIFNTFTSVPVKEIEEVHAWPSAQDAREDFALAVFNMTIKMDNNKNDDNDNKIQSKNGQSIFGNDCHYYDDFGIARSFSFHRDFTFAKRVSEVLLQRISVDLISKMLFDISILANPNECNNPINVAIIANRVLQLARKTGRANIVTDFSELLQKAKKKDNGPSDEKEKESDDNQFVMKFLLNVNDIETISKMIHFK